MLKIRLRRMGMKKQPTYRIVIAESTAPRDGRFVEIIGTYNARTEPETVEIKEARALHWLSVGAQPTPSVARILRTHGTMERFERLRAGEELETLVAEAETGETAEPALTEPALAEEEETDQTATEDVTLDVAGESDQSEAEGEAPETVETSPEVEEENEVEEEEAAEDTAEATEQASDEGVETEES
jgi:small subunit ribosomal protein S16